MIYKEKNEKSAKYKWLFLYLFIWTRWEKHESLPQNSKLMNINYTGLRWGKLYDNYLFQSRGKNLLISY